MAQDIKAKVKALAEFKDCDLSDIDYDEATELFDVDGETYRIYTEDEANDEVRQQVEWDLDDMGLDAYSESFQDWIVNNAMDQDMFEDECRYFYESEVENNDEEWLVSECLDLGIIDEDEVNEDGEYTGNRSLYDEYVEYQFYRTQEQYDGNFVDWYRDYFGDDDLRYAIKNARFDYDAIADELISWDGYLGLSRYDGQVHEIGDFYIIKD